MEEEEEEEAEGEAGGEAGASQAPPPTELTEWYPVLERECEEGGRLVVKVYGKREGQAGTRYFWRTGAG